MCMDDSRLAFPVPIDGWAVALAAARRAGDFPVQGSDAGHARSLCGGRSAALLGRRGAFNARRTTAAFGAPR
jgi:hypothetical protein